MEGFTGVAIVLIVLIGNLAFFGTIAAIVLVPRMMKNRERRQMQETIRAAIDKGQPLTPEVLEAIGRDISPVPSAQRDARAGIVWLAIGAGLAALGAGLNGFDEDAVGLAVTLGAIPIMIGLAFIAMSFFNNKNK